MLYWAGEYNDLLNDLNNQSTISSNQLFFWMSILNNSNEIQTLFDRTMNWLIENNEEHTLEFITMMVKAKRNEDLLEYLINHDHIE